MATCFVMQPFDRGRFDKRYSEVFAPAIKAAGLEPYRVDKDPGVEIPINEIEAGIREAVLCLADISLDNPNVWFELGYAISARKTVVLVCSKERTGKFPFDVQHRTIISYDSESPSDFKALHDQILARVNAVLKKAESLQVISASSDLAPVQGLTQHEIAVLAALVGSLDHPGDVVTPDSLRRDVTGSGFTRVAYSIGLKSLNDKGFVKYETAGNVEGDTWSGYQLTETGWQWVTRNQGMFSVRDTPAVNPSDVPF